MTFVSAVLLKIGIYMYYTINVCVSKYIRLCNIYIKSMSVVQRSFVVNEVLLT